MLNFSKNYTAECDVNVMYNTSKADCVPHTHDFVEIMFCTKGHSIQLIDGKSYDIHRGSLLFINYKQVHEIKNIGDCCYYNILMDPGLFSESFKGSENAFELLSLSTFNELGDIDTTLSAITFEKAETDKIEAVISLMYDEFRQKKSNYLDVIKGLLSALLVFVFRKMAEGMGTASKLKIPVEIIDYIDQHYCERISLEELSRHCFYNPTYFSKMFKECYGITLSDYIIKKRIENASKLLLETNMSIEDVFARCGYTDKALFYKHFKKVTGKTPGKLRS